MNENRELSVDNIQYGMLVEVHHETGGYHTGCKVHFFNKKGVLVGNYYEFVPYKRLRRRPPYKGKPNDYQRFFFQKPFESVKNLLFIQVLKVVTKLMRWTQKYMD